MNYKLIISYDGSNFAGWQIQPAQKTIQGAVSEAIKTILKKDVNLIGSGRTDAGVHAWGQTANFRFDKKIDLNKFKYSLNGILPSEIAIREITLTNEEFHSRYDAVSRIYLYLFSLGKNPFYARFSCRADYLNNYNLQKLNSVSRLLLGKRDFSSFAKSKSEVKNKICHLRKFRWRRTGDLIFVLVEADRFLHGMVKALIGAVLKAYKENNPDEYLMKILSAKDRRAAPEGVPSGGLCLFKVKY